MTEQEIIWIEKYNEDRPESEHISNMGEFNRAMLDLEIKNIKSVFGMNKFTEEEFKEHYKEFIENFNTKYRLLDLDFKMIMLMRGCSVDEFKMQMDTIAKKDTYPNHVVWEDEVRYDDSSDGENDGVEEGDGREDHNEY